MPSGSSTGRPRSVVKESGERLRIAPTPKRRLTILVVGTDDWAADQSAGVLQSSGHRVLACHEPGEAAFPCNALIPGRRCPLDVGFDVVLTARARPLSAPAEGEMGVVCALHEGTPLVVAGISAENPFVPWTTSTVASDGDVADACETAVTSQVFDLRP